MKAVTAYGILALPISTVLMASAYGILALQISIVMIVANVYGIIRMENLARHLVEHLWVDFLEITTTVSVNGMDLWLENSATLEYGKVDFTDIGPG